MTKWEVIIEAIVMLVVALIVGALIPWVKSWLRTKLNQEQFKELEAWANAAVKAAEMIFKETGAGPLKKSHVIEFLHNVLLRLNIDISEEQLNDIIEAAVYKLKNGG